jgi:hypothetical protein
MEVTAVTVTVTGRRPVVPAGRRRERIAEEVVPPGQILIFLTHAHPLFANGKSNTRKNLH